MRLWKLCVLLLCASLVPCAQAQPPVPNTEWPVVGNDPGGQRFSPLTQINKSNVSKLQIAWRYRNGDFSRGERNRHSTSFEATPILVKGRLYFCTPFNRIIALDPRTGTEIWTYDPKVEFGQFELSTCRGVTYWEDPQAAEGTACKSRIYEGTADARIVAVDAETGRPCTGFGSVGFVSLLPSLGDTLPGEVWISSPPVVVNGVLITNHTVRDNIRDRAPGGGVHGFDARTGELKWVWDSVDPGQQPVTAEDIKEGATLTRGTPNSWSWLSVDSTRGVVYVPTGNPSVDNYTTSDREGRLHYGSSVVALDAATGKPRWSFQTTHHDIWDYDVAAQPTLYTHKKDGQDIPGIIVATKMGFVFLLNRDTGEPIFPVEERPVPQSTVTGERTAPTQPFPTKPEPLARMELTREMVWGLTPWDRHKCRQLFDQLDYDGPYTPPSLEKAGLVLPGSAGGINWGSASVDPVNNRMIVNVLNMPSANKLVPREQLDPDSSGQRDFKNFEPMEDTPYVLKRTPFFSPWKIPCLPPPWSKIVAIDLNTGKTLWEKPLGNLNKLAPLGIGRFLEWGTVAFGGSIQTAGNLVFIGASADGYFRAFDATNGEKLWEMELPFSANSIPMSYAVDGKQYIVVAAGGHTTFGTETGDELVAFSLPRQ